MDVPLLSTRASKLLPLKRVRSMTMLPQLGVGVMVGVLVSVGVKVLVGVRVFVGVNVFVGVRVGVNVLVGVDVFVGVSVSVRVGDGVTVSLPTYGFGGTRGLYRVVGREFFVDEDVCDLVLVGGQESAR